MTPLPKRLLEDHACEPSVRALIERASRETGSTSAKARTLAALGLAGAAAAGGVATMGGAGGATTAGAGAATTAGAGAATIAGAGATTIAGGAATLGVTSFGLALKIAAGVVLAGVVGSSIALTLRAPESHTPPPPTASAVHALNGLAPGVAASTSALASSHEPGTPVEALTSVPQLGVADSPPPAAAKPARPTAASAESEPPRTTRSMPLPKAPVPALPATALGPTPEVAASSHLVEEAAALELARLELVAGRAVSALAALDGYDQRFPRGELHPEATALRVEALWASKDHSAARALGASFLAQHPQHPAAVRVRRALDKAPP